MVSVGQKDVARIDFRWAMIPTMAVAETGKIFRHPRCVGTQSFAQMKGLSAFQKSRLGSHVNSTATVRSLPNFQIFLLLIPLSFRFLSSPGQFQRAQRHYRFRPKCEWFCLSQFCLPVRIACVRLQTIRWWLTFPRFANVTAGSQCEIENTGYVGYGPSGEFVYVVSR